MSEDWTGPLSSKMDAVQRLKNLWLGVTYHEAEVKRIQENEAKPAEQRSGDPGANSATLRIHQEWLERNTAEIREIEKLLIENKNPKQSSS